MAVDDAYTDTDWHHIAQVRYGNTMTLYIGGVAQTTTANVTGITCANSPNKVAIGRRGESNSLYWNGWLDEFRFSKGIARWTANFTPPTMAYSVSGVRRMMLLGAG